MLYALNEFGYYASTPWRFAARAARDFWSNPANPAADSDFGRNAYAAADLFSNVTRRYGKPEWRISETEVNDQPVRVTPTVTWSSPWVNMIHFARSRTDMRKGRQAHHRPGGADRGAAFGPLRHPAARHGGDLPARPRGLHHRLVQRPPGPLMEGRFDFHDYIDLVRQMLTALGDRAHVVAVCQPWAAGAGRRPP